jgi:uncharacterized protein (UPF0332 family)
LTPATEAFLRKARESLASAEADLRAGRFNSAASRAYYAVFQAAVAALKEQGVAPRGASWDHKFVISEFSGKLIRRRKVVSARLTGTLDILLQRRLRADYRPAGLGRREASDSTRRAQVFVQELKIRLIEQELS